MTDQEQEKIAKDYLQGILLKANEIKSRLRDYFQENSDDESVFYGASENFQDEIDEFIANSEDKFPEELSTYFIVWDINKYRSEIFDSIKLDVFLSRSWCQNTFDTFPIRDAVYQAQQRMKKEAENRK